MSYGMGWVVHDYRGHRVLAHSGAIDGFRVQLTLVPEANLAIALVNNLDRTWMNFALSNTLVDRFCGLKHQDWNQYCEDINDRVEQYNKRTFHTLISSQKKGTTPSLPLKEYTGKYVDPAYGLCEISLVNGELHWKWNKIESRLEHFHFDTFLAREGGADALALTFQLSDTGFPASLHAMDRSFRRVP